MDATEEEVAVSDVTVNKSDSASENNPIGDVLQHYGFTRQTVSQAKVQRHRKCAGGDVLCDLMSFNTINIIRHIYRECREEKKVVKSHSL